MGKKRVLIPGGREADCGMVNAAHRMGMYVITSGTHDKDPAHRLSDEYVFADYSDKEAMLALAKEKNIDYMVSNSNDFGMISTAYVCEQLGLPGHDSYETTVRLHTKDTFKAAAKKIGIHSPVSEIFDNRDEAIAFLRNVDQKYIIKPCDNVGSNGVCTPESTGDIEKCVDFAFTNTKKGKILAEPFIEGFFVPVTSMIINKKVQAFFTEAYFPYPEGVKVGPRFPINYHCTGYQIPAPFADEFSPEIIEDFEKIAREFDLVDGKFHCELLITPEHKAWIFDVHRRISGVFVPKSHWDISGEITWEDWVLRAECGMDLSGFPKDCKQRKYVHSRNIYAPKDGLIKRLIFDEYLSSHLYPSFEGERFVLNNLFTFDHLHKPVVDNYPENGGLNLVFRFDESEKEAAEKLFDHTSNEFYSHLTFEYEN